MPCALRAGFLTSLAAGLSALLSAGFFASLAEASSALFAGASLLPESADAAVSFDSAPEVSTRLRFFSASPLKSVSYQPPPLSRNTGADIKRRSASLPHSGHLRSGESPTFCSASTSWAQASQRYS